MTQPKCYFFDLHDIKYCAVVHIHISYLDEEQIKYLCHQFNIKIDNDEEDYEIDDDDVKYYFDAYSIEKDIILSIYDDLVKYFENCGYVRKDKYEKIDIEKEFSKKEAEDAEAEAFVTNIELEADIMASEEYKMLYEKAKEAYPDEYDYLIQLACLSHLYESKS